MKRFGLIGYPLAHSFSKQYFTEKFERLGLRDWEYELYPIASISELDSLLKKNPQLAGLNVTIPYKEAVMPLLTEIDPVAKAAGAVNTVRITYPGGECRLEGFNTDVHGFEESLKPLLKPQHKKALILGTGGGAKAVQYVLGKLGIAYTQVSRLRSGEAIQYSDIDASVIDAHKLIIDTTPLGMYPDTAGYPQIPYEHLGPDHLLYDLVYDPAETIFLEKGRGQGAATKNGLEMLYLQAEKAWEIWND